MVFYNSELLMKLLIGLDTWQDFMDRDQPYAKPLPAQDSATQKNANIHVSSGI
jgi:hypothetical protein